MTDRTQEALLAGLAAQAGALENAAEDLRTAYRFSRQLKVIFAIGAVMLIANGAMLAILIGLTNMNRENGAAIRSCTTPGGECYQRGQQATAKAVGQIVAEVNAHTNLVFLATLECSGRGLSGHQLAACMRSHGIR